MLDCVLGCHKESLKLHKNNKTKVSRHTRRLEPSTAQMPPTATRECSHRQSECMLLADRHTYCYAYSLQSRAETKAGGALVRDAEGCYCYSKEFKIIGAAAHEWGAQKYCCLKEERLRHLYARLQAASGSVILTTYCMRTFCRMPRPVEAKQSSLSTQSNRSSQTRVLRDAKNAGPHKPPTQHEQAVPAAKHRRETV